jgi:hypothetical protein
MLENIGTEELKKVLEQVSELVRKPKKEKTPKKGAGYTRKRSTKRYVKGPGKHKRRTK